MQAAQHWLAPRAARWQDKRSKIVPHSALPALIVKRVQGQRRLIARPRGKMFAGPANAAEPAGQPPSIAAVSVAEISEAAGDFEEAEVASAEAVAAEAAAGDGPTSE